MQASDSIGSIRRIGDAEQDWDADRAANISLFFYVKQNRLQIFEGPRLEFEIPRDFDCRTHKVHCTEISSLRSFISTDALALVRLLAAIAFAQISSHQHSV